MIADTRYGIRTKFVSGKWQTQFKVSLNDFSRFFFFPIWEGLVANVSQHSQMYLRISLWMSLLDYAQGETLTLIGEWEEADLASMLYKAGSYFASSG